MGTSCAADVVVEAVQVCGRPAGGSHPENEQHVQQQKNEGGLTVGPMWATQHTCFLFSDVSLLRLWGKIQSEF